MQARYQVRFKFTTKPTTTSKAPIIIDIPIISCIPIYIVGSFHPITLWVRVVYLPCTKSQSARDQTHDRRLFQAVPIKRIRDRVTKSARWYIVSQRKMGVVASKSPGDEHEHKTRTDAVGQVPKDRNHVHGNGQAAHSNNDIPNTSGSLGI